MNTLSQPHHLRQLLRYVRPYRGPLTLALLATACSSLLGLIFPYFVGRLVNTALLSHRLSRLNHLALALVLVFSAQAGFVYLTTYLLTRIGQGIVADLRRDLFGHLLFLPVRFFEKRAVGEITSRLTADVGTVQNAVSNSLVQFLSQALTLIGGIGIIFATSWRLSLLMLLVVPVVVLMILMTGERLRRLSTEVQDQLAEANAGAEEALSSIRIVQAFNAEEWELKRYAERIQRSFQSALRVGRQRAFFIAAIQFASFACLSLVLWYGGHLVLLRQISVGGLVAFLFYTFYIALSIAGLTGLYAGFQETLGATRRIFAMFQETSELRPLSPVRHLSKVQGRVVFEQVHFHYPEGPEVLHGISLQAKPGQMIALVGPSGAGKSTLISLIPRFYDPQRGSVQLDGIDLRHLDPAELRRHIALVPQEVQLFSGTILDNLRYGRPEATWGEIQAAAQASHAATFIEQLPEGYATPIGEKGMKLSGGQRQMIAIARALLKNPRVLILDEATSSLDSESETYVQQALEVLMKGRTTFVIAHRLSTVRNADLILVLNHGRIIERGTHAELINRGGLYQELYQLQFGHQAHR
jgi:subfamily B ATP-binding cassette protein MsbA